jgi:hypothetical protein
MYDPDEWTHDEDGNPEYLGPAKTEPDCMGCADGGYVRAGRLARLLGRRDRRCPSCNPSWLTHRLFVIRWHPAVVAVLPRRRYRGVEVVDEPPF